MGCTPPRTGDGPRSGDGRAERRPAVENGLRGTALSKARKANEQYILTARADMRGRLVQAALEGKLTVGQANLPGFAASAPVDLTQLDDVIL